METKEAPSPLEELFPEGVPKELASFEKMVDEDDFNPFPTVVFIDGHEVRLSYSPSDMAVDGERTVKITGIQDAPESTLRRLGTHFSKDDLKVNLARYDGRSKHEDIDF
jgi:hypothetical protein